MSSSRSISSNVWIFFVVVRRQRVYVVSRKIFWVGAPGKKRAQMRARVCCVCVWYSSLASLVLTGYTAEGGGGRTTHSLRVGILGQEVPRKELDKRSEVCVCLCVQVTKKQQETKKSRRDGGGQTREAATAAAAANRKTRRRERKFLQEILFVLNSVRVRATNVFQQRSIEVRQATHTRSTTRACPVSRGERECGEAAWVDVNS